MAPESNLLHLNRPSSSPSELTNHKSVTFDPAIAPGHTFPEKLTPETETGENHRHHCLREKYQLRTDRRDGKRWLLNDGPYIIDIFLRWLKWPIAQRLFGYNDYLFPPE